MTNLNKNKNSKIGVGLAGLGFGEKVHLPALNNNKFFNPIAFWHHRKERLDEACKDHNLTGYEDWSKFLNDPNIDAVVIATPPEIRFRLAMEALRKGKHLLLEKPIALNSNEIKEIQIIAMKMKLSVAVDFEYRAVPLFMQAKKLLDSGLLGDHWLVKMDWLMSSRADKNRPWNWYSQSEKGGGVIGALGTHAFDLLHWLIGPTKHVMGSTSTSIKERLCPTTNEYKAVTSEDICFAQLELQNSDYKSVPAQVALSSISRNGRGCWIEIYGSNGTLIIGSDNQKDYVHGFGLWFAENGNKPTSINSEKTFSFQKTWEDGRIAPVKRIQEWWAESIQKSSPMIPGLTEGLLSQKVCESIIESSESGIRLDI